MKLTCGGARGSWPVSASGYQTYGGDTTAILIEGATGETILIDAGTGIAGLGKIVSGRREKAPVLLLFTHYHLDHVAGLPTLELLYDETARIDVRGPEILGLSVREALVRVLTRPLWPFELKDYPAEIHWSTFDTDKQGSWDFGALTIRSCPLHHHEGCVAYRIDEKASGGSCVLATDVEWQRSSPEGQERFLALCRSPGPAGLLVFDGHWPPDTYERFAGWGHSTWRDALSVAREVGAGSLLLTHHAPEQDDTALADMERDLTSEMPAAAFLRAGMVIDVPPNA